MNNSKMEAVFLDRDGVLTELVRNPATGEYEPPHSAENVRMIDGSIGALRQLAENGFMLILISNQPDYAKGKTTLENLRTVHETFHLILKKNGILFTEYRYCYHHPEGVIPGYAVRCRCRKPNPSLLRDAERRHGLDLSHSWLVGDRDSDIVTAQGSGVRTILVEYEYSKAYRGKSTPDFRVKDLREAAGIINS